MKNIKFLLAFLAIAVALTSCKKIATVEVVNQNNCDYNFFQGSSSSGEYLGTVNANSTKSFEIELEKGLFSDLIEDAGDFYAEPNGCFGYSDEYFYVELKKKKTSTILID